MRLLRFDMKFGELHRWPFCCACWLACSLAVSSWSSAQDLLTTPGVPVMRQISPDVYEAGKLRLDKKANTVSFPARINMARGALEYLLVTPQGSTHESLFVTDIQPADLHFAMLLLGAKGAGLTTPAPADAPPGQLDAEYLRRAPKLKGDALTITATWTAEGRPKTERVENWIWNDQTKKAAVEGPWIYTGSMFAADQFLAQTEGLFAALVTNPAALINNPRQGNDNDALWTVHEKAVPPADTPVEITIRLDAE